MNITIADTICASLGCINRLGYFDIKNGRRFCRKCRQVHNVLRWKCRGCPNILNSSQCRETRKFCDSCKGMKND